VKTAIVQPMNLTSLSSVDFKNILKLLEQKETLQAQVAKIDGQLASYESGGPAETAPGKPGPKPAARIALKPRPASGRNGAQ